MKLNIYNDSEGIFKHVSEMPEEPDCNCQIIGVCECKRRQSFLLEKIKSSSIRFKDQELVARFIAEQKPKQLNKWALAIESLSSIIFHSDTFYSIELEGYEVGFGIRCDADCMGMCGECSKGEKVAILKPVASQKETTMKKTLQEIKDEVSKKHFYLNWNELYCNLSYSDFIKIEDEAAELYIYQKDSPSKEEPICDKGCEDPNLPCALNEKHCGRISSKEQGLQKEIEHMKKCSFDDACEIGNLKKEIEQLKQSLSASERFRTADAASAIKEANDLRQSNKELLEALKIAFRYMSVMSDPVAYVLIRELIQKHSNPPSTANQEPDYYLSDITNKNPEYVHPSTVNEKEEQIPISHMIDVLTVYGHFPYEESLHELIEDFPKRWNIKRLETCHWYQTIGVEIIKEITRKEQI
jgi:hypothetical protein